MRNAFLAAAAAFVLALPIAAQDAQSRSDSEAVAQKETAPGPADIVNAAPQEDWVVIPPEDLLVMTLAPDAEGNARKVVIQLMPPPFSQGWVENIRLLARERWYDGTSVNRVQDNYVVQWGDPNYDNPESDGAAKPLPVGLATMVEDAYAPSLPEGVQQELEKTLRARMRARLALDGIESDGGPSSNPSEEQKSDAFLTDPYAAMYSFYQGWPLGLDPNEETRGDGKPKAWPVHCYGMVGVGRNYSPDTGSGAELYTVIGHAPRHLDRNIALVGRVIGGMEHLSSLPRGSGALGFYSEEEKDKRTPILSVRIASELPEEERPLYEYLSTESETFAAYAEARANRRDPFFIVPAGGADICNIPVPVREFEYADGE
ncbi:peptidylprolyl isomerase [Erythrobacter sp.]|uniref:peptidylprolyl isomerase n=1 Tax=Erythrobacter sp. TaxID=1042 RepID=UPI001425D88E|nr:peptidylprolyl isomerase [Erythrobacter sp.]QIQ85354.1 MAG: peptidylprolyl isomerase [Erythrobacter sp.]